jgi:hypothetical protein
MKKLMGKKRRIKHRPPIYSGLDSHKWPTKMEICRLLSGKRDLILKTVEKQTA